MYFYKYRRKCGKADHFFLHLVIIQGGSSISSITTYIAVSVSDVKIDKMAWARFQSLVYKTKHWKR